MRADNAPEGLVQFPGHGGRRHSRQNQEPLLTVGTKTLARGLVLTGIV